MSDLLEIVRKKEGVLNPIQREEIQALVQHSKNLQIVLSHLKSGVLDVTVVDSNGNTCVITLLGGKLLTNNTGNQALSVMLWIAQKLNARVRGSDFETYDSLTKSYLHPEDVLEKGDAKKFGQQALMKSRRQHQYIKFSFILFFILLGLLAFGIGKIFEH